MAVFSASLELVGTTIMQAIDQQAKPKFELRRGAADLSQAFRPS
jgi:hypothetical protein